MMARKNINFETPAKKGTPAKKPPLKKADCVCLVKQAFCCSLLDSFLSCILLCSFWFLDCRLLGFVLTIAKAKAGPAETQWQFLPWPPEVPWLHLARCSVYDELNLWRQQRCCYKGRHAASQSSVNS